MFDTMTPNSVLEHNGDGDHPYQRAVPWPGGLPRNGNSDAHKNGMQRDDGQENRLTESRASRVPVSAASKSINARPSSIYRVIIYGAQSEGDTPAMEAAKCSALLLLHNGSVGKTRVDSSSSVRYEIQASIVGGPCLCHANDASPYAHGKHCRLQQRSSTASTDGTAGRESPFGSCGRQREDPCRVAEPSPRRTPDMSPAYAGISWHMILLSHLGRSSILSLQLLTR